MDKAMRQEDLNEMMRLPWERKVIVTAWCKCPQCGEFAGIAQDLDFVVAALRERLGEKA